MTMFSPQNFLSCVSWTHSSMYFGMATELIDRERCSNTDCIANSRKKIYGGWWLVLL